MIVFNDIQHGTMKKNENTSDYEAGTVWLSNIPTK